jgi:hypothetical protein
MYVCQNHVTAVVVQGLRSETVVELVFFFQISLMYPSYCHSKSMLLKTIQFFSE